MLMAELCTSEMEEYFLQNGGNQSKTEFKDYFLNLLTDPLWAYNSFGRTLNFDVIAARDLAFETWKTRRAQQGALLEALYFF